MWYGSRINFKYYLLNIICFELMFYIGLLKGQDMLYCTGPVYVGMCILTVQDMQAIKIAINLLVTKFKIIGKQSTCYSILLSMAIVQSRVSYDR